VAVLPASAQQKILPKIDEYWMAIGTFPLLVINGAVRQGLERAKERAYRSAIGTKSNDICFAVSEEQLTLNEWAQHLVGKGYAGALYLDGGPYASLAARDAASKPYTRGQRTTIVQARMIISAELQ
jgi:uncharacterized protein YigE (DUF2233 family)